MFEEHEVIFHYRGKELQGLEIDIWIPTLKLGFEYQGIQHFQSVEHWGGSTAFSRLQENDRKKKSLCKELNYQLVEISFDEIISRDTIAQKLKILTKD